MTLALDRRSLMAGAFTAAAAAALPGCVARADTRGFFDREGLPIGIQLYALGEEAQKDIDGTLKHVAEVGFRDLELPGLMGREPAAIRQAADSAGLAISSVHVPTSGDFSLASDPRRLADALATLGARQAVVPMFPIPQGFKLQKGENLAAAFTRAIRDAGEAMWKNLAAQLNEKAALLKPHGIALGYHNHSLEFLPLGTGTGWDILARETDPGLVHFEADVGWLVSAGVDPIAFFRRHSGRVRQLHVKDVKKGFVPNTEMRTDPTEVGTGSVDWASVLPAAYAAGARHFYYEQEPPFAIPRIEAAARSYNFLAGLKA